MELTQEQLDRARGMVLGAAVGDALGAGYEFAQVREDLVPEMIGGGLGNFEPGEWTDDTSLTWIVAEAAAEHKTFDTSDSLDMVARGFRTWYDTHPPDIGGTTSRAISGAGKAPDAAGMRVSALRANGSTNGSLMRTSPVVLPYLDDPDRLVVAAKAVSALTHSAWEATGACAVWSLILRHAVLTGELDVDEALQVLPVVERSFWSVTVHAAMTGRPSTFHRNGRAVVALQAALSSVTHSRGYDFVDSLYTAVRIGHDTDTVASIAGALVGALHGVDAIPQDWLDIAHGYPGKTGSDLDKLVIEALQ